MTVDPFRMARLVLQLRQEGVTDASVLATIETVDRAAFCDTDTARALAADDTVLPIGCGQVMLRLAATAHLLQALAIPPDRAGRVLLAGAGNGYTAALLVAAGAQVVAVERFRTLAEGARARLAALGIAGVEVVHGDALAGDPPGDAFERIVLTGSVTAVPPALLGRLVPEGLMVGPLETGRRRSLVVWRADGTSCASPFPYDAPALQPGLAALL